MNERDEQRTAAILVELRRLGVDLGLLSGPLAGTGLRASTLLEWLRAIPDDVGADELLRRVDEYGHENTLRPREIRWPRVPAPSPHRYRRERWWPTQELLDAGTDLLLDEWDPFGIRLAGTDRETVALLAFHFFGPLLAPNDTTDAIAASAMMIGIAERDELALRPSPESHRRYLAGRLADLVMQHPVPLLPERETPSRSVVTLTGPADHEAPPALDPEGVCAQCHRFGTVARVTTMGATAPRTKRYCASCWREVRQPNRIPAHPETASDHIAFLDDIERPPVATESRSWEDTRDFIEMVVTHARDADPPVTDAQFAELARAIVAMEGVMESAMPPDIEAFVQRYGPHA